MTASTTVRVHVQLIGVAETGVFIAIAQNGPTLCAIDATGTWNCPLTPTSGGPFALSVTATDIAGNSSAPGNWNTDSDALFRSGFDTP